MVKASDWKDIDCKVGVRVQVQDLRIKAVASVFSSFCMPLVDMSSGGIGR